MHHNSSLTAATVPVTHNAVRVSNVLMRVVFQGKAFVRIFCASLPISPVTTLTVAMLPSILSASLCAQTASGIIAGTVVNSATGAPINRAAVVLSRRDTHISQTTTVAGQFSFDNLAAGSYELVATLTDPRQPTRPITRSVPVPIVITQTNEPVKDVTVKLVLPGILSGHIVDAQGAPLPGLPIAALRQQYDLTGKLDWVQVAGTTTNQRGDYRLAPLPPGMYLVMTTETPLRKAVGRVPDNKLYPRTFYPGMLERSQATRVPVVGQEVAGIDFQVQPHTTYDVRGIINKPQAVKAVMAWVNEEGIKVIDSHIPANENAFALQHLLSGTYTLYVEPEDTADGWLGVQTVQITDHNLTDITIDIMPAMNIYGSIRMEGDSLPPPLNNVRITLDGTAVYFLPSASVSRSNTFVLPSVVPTPFSVYVSGLPDNCYVKSIRYGNSEVQGLATPSLGSKLDITLASAAASMEGTVSDGDGKSESGVVIIAVPEVAGQPFHTARSDLYGRFHLGGLPPGRYYLLALTSIDYDMLNLTELRALSARLGLAVDLSPSVHRIHSLTVTSYHGE
jgi:hypothetical protein